MARSLRVLLVAGLLFAGSQASATAVVDYDLSASSLSITAPLAIAVPSSQIDASSAMTMSFAESGGIILTGGSSAVSLDVFSLMLNLNISPLGLMNITGTVTTTLMGPVAGATLDAAGNVSFAASPLASFQTTGSVTCVDLVPGFCGVVGMTSGVALPINVLQAISMPDMSIVPGTINAPPQLLSGSLPFNLPLATPVSGQFNLSATETSRALVPASVPEVRVLWMVATGIAGLITYGSQRRSNRETRHRRMSHRRSQDVPA